MSQEVMELQITETVHGRAHIFMTFYSVKKINQTGLMYQLKSAAVEANITRANARLKGKKKQGELIILGNLVCMNVSLK